MNEKPVKVDIGFQEALRRIAKTPKNSVASEPLAPKASHEYNRKEATERPPPRSRKTTD